MYIESSFHGNQIMQGSSLLYQYTHKEYDLFYTEIAIQCFFLILPTICMFFVIYLNLLLGNALPWLPTIQSHYNDNLA